MLSLSTPTGSAYQHSCAVQEMICAEIATAGGWIPFTRYMELALYAPGMGYYCGGAAKFGGTGDFVTAPEISQLFGKAVAQQGVQVLECMGENSNNILEFGAGSGKLALDLLLEMEKLERLPKHYFILEVSGELQNRQKELFEKLAPHLLSRVDWLEHLPAKFEGLILANEVLDAMPVHLVVWRGTNLFERGVAWNGRALEWSDHILVNRELFKVARELSPQINSDGENVGTYVSEISLSTRRFMRSLAGILQQGAIVLIDYGFGYSEYYHSQRNRGTLMCHYRHHAHEDPFYFPGLQDITSHVDFSAISQVATAEGLELLGYTSQAHFLINCGITEILARIPAENAGDFLPLANQLQKLVSPAEMGELFKVIVFGKNIQQPLVGFTSGDKSRQL
ncbi:MAG: class I SAM-dependent methyltransferase [Betaproteobacteria bacterium]|nr:MAG: class I SAM-dependent methyltransferase [Betaproteobacteria bacterium]